MRKQYPLAVFAPQIGARSETFIRRHMNDLLPDKTVVVASTDSGSYAGHWTVDGPTFVIQSPKRSVRQRLMRAFNEQCGRPHLEIEHFLRKQGVRVMLAEWLDLALPWMEVADRLGIKFWGHAHGYDISENLRSDFWREQYRHYNNAQGVITMSEISRQRLINCGVKPEKIHVIPYGVKVPVALPKIMQKNGVVRCVTVGRMVAKKSPILLLDAFRRALNENSALHLDYVGEGELFSAAYDFVRAFGMESHVTFHGGHSNEFVRELLLNSDIYLQHSITDVQTGDEEGLPVSILEAMASGLPIISTRHAGIPEAVVDGQTGMLVDEGDSKAMSVALLNLAKDANRRDVMRQHSWQRARARFSWEQNRQTLLQTLGLENFA